MAYFQQLQNSFEGRHIEEFPISVESEPSTAQIAQPVWNFEATLSRRRKNGLPNWWCDSVKPDGEARPHRKPHQSSSSSSLYVQRGTLHAVGSFVTELNTYWWKLEQNIFESCGRCGGHNAGIIYEAKASPAETEKPTKAKN
ncbi:mannosyl-glycoprotein endo-beta-N-acetylglucosaminidase [Anopheles sinensis]|uniref:Mannosyl-glycoprotein endo-beta-N-acetylglucosaminidase n=1 Tax=Anopheles sinensis TaxID=74873 RepID=A0A084WHM7_ANOSI|nr:mannosyl-glycoprotein endo-beta-N-acetylglucosaminidase [Anopheles sinensis]